MARKIVTHGGEPHLDEILSVAMVLAHDPEVDIIERRNPCEEDFEDPEIWVLDQGGRVEPELRNFDHHHMACGVQECTLSLLADHLAISDYLKRLPWFNIVVQMDSLGPYKAAELYGCSADVIRAIYTPFAEFFLFQFKDVVKLISDDQLFIDLKAMGVNTMSYYHREQKRLTLLREKSEIIRMGQTDVIIFLENVDEPSMALHSFASEKGISGGIALVIDERNPGWCLKRLFEDPAIDLHRIDGDPRVIFAHTSGFIAKIRKVERSDIEELITRSRVS